MTKAMTKAQQIERFKSAYKIKNSRQHMQMVCSAYDNEDLPTLQLSKFWNLYHELLRWRSRITKDGNFVCTLEARFYVPNSSEEIRISVATAFTSERLKPKANPFTSNLILFPPNNSVLHSAVDAATGKFIPINQSSFLDQDSNKLMRLSSKTRTLVQDIAIALAEVYNDFFKQFKDGVASQEELEETGQGTLLDAYPLYSALDQSYIFNYLAKSFEVGKYKKLAPGHFATFCSAFLLIPILRTTSFTELSQRQGNYWLPKNGEFRVYQINKNLEKLHQERPVFERFNHAMLCSYKALCIVEKALPGKLNYAPVNLMSVTEDIYGARFFKELLQLEFSTQRPTAIAEEVVAYVTEYSSEEFETNVTQAHTSSKTNIEELYDGKLTKSPTVEKVPSKKVSQTKAKAISEYRKKDKATKPTTQEKLTLSAPTFTAYLGDDFDAI